jgi:hypothetical protein
MHSVCLSARAILAGTDTCHNARSRCHSARTADNSPQRLLGWKGSNPLSAQHNVGGATDSNRLRVSSEVRAVQSTAWVPRGPRCTRTSSRSWARSSPCCCWAIGSPFSSSPEGPSSSPPWPSAGRASSPSRSPGDDRSGTAPGQRASAQRPNPTRFVWLLSPRGPAPRCRRLLLQRREDDAVAAWLLGPAAVTPCGRIGGRGPRLCEGSARRA